MSLLIKIGTSTITNKIGEIDSVILKNIVSQVAYLHKQNKEIVLVTSGAVACGKHILATTCCNNNNDNNQSSFLSLRSQAAIGQPYLINSYNQEFIKHNIISAQVLLQDIDFRELDRVNSIKDVIKSLTSKGIIPILNENDATTIRKQDYRDGEGKILWDNDSLATLVAKAISCDSLILLSNIDGVIDISGNLIRVWDDNYFKTLGNLEDSGYGRGGILSKIKAASQAAEHGIDTFIINGKVPDILLSNELTGVRGTHFRVHQKSFISSRLNISNNSNKLDKSNKATSILKVIKNAKENSEKHLRHLSHKKRCELLKKYKRLLLENRESILEENQEDLEKQKEVGISSQLYNRLRLTNEKIEILTNGIDALIEMPDPIGKMVDFRNIRHPFITGLTLEWSRCQIPMGLIFVIFESRPDVLVQLLALAVISGNGMILKGGHEAENSLKSLFSLFLAATPLPLLSSFNLLFTREEAEVALSSSDINLCIPRGGTKFIEWVKTKSVAPVIGHGSGICCAYIANDINLLEKENLELIRHSKLDYTAACNSLEILLVDKFHFSEPDLVKALSYWRDTGIELLANKTLCEDYPYFHLVEAPENLEETGDNRLLLVQVDDIESAISYINTYGSHHTDMIMTNNSQMKQQFWEGLKSSCVFLNTSTRCSDGYRMNMGCEVGINTNINSWYRGPVGIEALMTTQIRLM